MVLGGGGGPAERLECGVSITSMAAGGGGAQADICRRFGRATERSKRRKPRTEPATPRDEDRTGLDLGPPTNGAGQGRERRVRGGGGCLVVARVSLGGRAPARRER